jgi:hypothetical protein
MSSRVSTNSSTLTVLRERLVLWLWMHGWGSRPL